MPSYRYNALRRDGRPTSGEVSAGNRHQAIAQLAERGSFVTEMSQEGAAAPALRPGRWGRRRVALRSKAAMLAQLATALEAGLPLLAALRVVEEQAESPALRQLVAALAGQVQSGQSLSEAMAEHADDFTTLEVSMVRVGETAGVLDEVMRSLAAFSQRDLDFRERIRSAAVYPAFVLGLAAVSVVIIVTFILPRILETVADASTVLPWPTQALMALTRALRVWGWLGAIVLGLAAWRLRRSLATPAGRLAFDRFKLRLPILGTALRRVAVARFARTLGTLTQAGIQIVEAMQVLRGTLGNEALAAKIDEVTAGITQGKSIADRLRQTGEFPPLLVQVIAMGEHTGRLDELLLKTADAYERETAVAVQRVMTVLPAVLIVCLALIVAFILAAVLLPIVGMETLPAGG